MYKPDPINAAMGAQRLSNEKVAAKARITPKVVSAVRNGKQNILLSSLAAVAGAVGFEVEIRFVPKAESVQQEEPAAA